MFAEILRLSNFDPLNQSARSETASATAAADTTLILQGATGFVPGEMVVIEPGTERAEIVAIDSIDGDELALDDSLDYPHQAGSLVLQLIGDTIKVYRAPNLDGKEPAANTFVHLEDSVPTNPIEIQPDQQFTAITDPNGGSDYWYKLTYLNSETGAETDPSLSLSVRGGDFGHYASLADIREQAGFSVYDYVTDVQVNLARSQAESEINARIAGRGYKLPIKVKVPVLESITQLIGAGWLLSRSYGAGAEGTTKDGDRLAKQGRAMLDQIDAGTLQLVDIDGNVLPNTAETQGSSAAIQGSHREPIYRMGDEW